VYFVRVTKLSAIFVRFFVRHFLLPNNDGGIVDDLIIYKWKEEQYLLVVNASNIDKRLGLDFGTNDLGVEMKKFRMITLY
jgi:glycine cleavage system aminomethyltransferase T